MKNPSFEGFFYFSPVYDRMGMKEDLMYFIWRFKRFQYHNLRTTCHQKIAIGSTGIRNANSGPDFLEARIHIGDYLWHGSVEIHVASSDWYRHGHHLDDAYKNVILHVVWEHDVEVFISPNQPLPTLELKNFVEKGVLNAHGEMLSSNFAAIPCEKYLRQVSPFILDQWLERLFFERLERKGQQIQNLLTETKNDWEAVLFYLLMKSFGLNINGEIFLNMGKRIDYRVFRKIALQTDQTEAVLFGMAGWLQDPITDQYMQRLQKEYKYLKHKFTLNDADLAFPKFFKLRPSNFPTIRLSQLAALYQQVPNLFDKIIGATQRADYKGIFGVAATEYWDTHFTFGKQTSKRVKKITGEFIDVLILNVVIPIRYLYNQMHGKDDSYNEALFKLASEVKTEQNHIITKLKKVGFQINSSCEGQAVLHLYHQYCTRNKCLDCAIGCALIKG